MSFTIRCNKCQREVEITGKNVRDFVNEYDWGNHDFRVDEEMPIAAFVTYGMTNETVMCICGNVTK